MYRSIPRVQHPTNLRHINRYLSYDDFHQIISLFLVLLLACCDQCYQQIAILYYNFVTRCTGFFAYNNNHLGAHYTHIYPQTLNQHVECNCQVVLVDVEYYPTFKYKVIPVAQSASSLSSYTNDSSAPKSLNSYQINCTI